MERLTSDWYLKAFESKLWVTPLKQKKGTRETKKRNKGQRANDMEKAEGWSNWRNQSKPKKAAVTHIDPLPYFDRWLPRALEGTGDSVKCILGRKSCRQTDRRTHSPTYTLYKNDIDTVKPQFHCTYVSFNLAETRLFPPLSPLASPVRLIYPSSSAPVTLESLDWMLSCEWACFALCASTHTCMYGCLYP